MFGAVMRGARQLAGVVNVGGLIGLMTKGERREQRRKKRQYAPKIDGQSYRKVLLNLFYKKWKTK